MLTIPSVLVLGQGFVGSYLAAALRERQISYAATTRDGRDKTIEWQMSSDTTPTGMFVDCSALPAANYVVVTFPLQGQAAAEALVNSYTKHHCHKAPQGDNDAGIRLPFWIYLGSTRPFKGTRCTRFTEPDIIGGGLRVEAEKYIIRSRVGCVLNLAGLWGGKRDPYGWSRFYTDKDKVRRRLDDRSLHLIHGKDVAKAILLVVEYHKQNKSSSSTTDISGSRWLVSDQQVYDMLEILLLDERVYGYVQELLYEDEDVRKLLDASNVDDVCVGASAVAAAKVTKRIDSSHFWSQVGKNSQPDYLFGEK